MLKIRDLEVRYGGIRAVRGVSVDVAAGETVLLVGANGAGKSSLINAVAGTVAAQGGTMVFGERDLRGVACAARARLGIGYSPEGRRVFANMTVEENIRAGAFGRPGAQAGQMLHWIRDNFPLVADRARQPAGQLSGGEQQVVALARAVAASPALLLLDEPFLGLAPVWITRVSEAIRKLQARGMSILMTEQMARPALKLAQRAYVMRGGEVVHQGDAQAVSALALSDEYL